MVDIEVVELLDSSEDEAPAMQAEPDVEEVTVNRQIRAPEAAAGDDDDDAAAGDDIHPPDAAADDDDDDAEMEEQNEGSERNAKRDRIPASTL